jgi:uncharacterized protein
MNTYECESFVRNFPELDEMYNFGSKKISKNKKLINVVISHGNCIDGYMSETIVRKWMIENHVDMRSVIFMRGYYGNDNAKLLDIIKGKHVLICDFSYKSDFFEKMIKVTNGNILVLDHHVTALNDSKNIPDEYFVFDMKHSGAFLTWVFFNGFFNVPLPVLYVEDNDLWNKKLPMTKEFTSFMFTQKFEYDEYVKLFDENYLIEVFTLGKGMTIANDSHCESLIKKAVPMFMKIDKRYYFVATLCSAVLKSELGNILLKKFENVNFSVIYSHDNFNGLTAFSLRSSDDKSDTTQIAKFFGGGGHRNASGMGVNGIHHNIPGRIIEQHRVYNMLENSYLVEINAGSKIFNMIMLNSPIYGSHLAKYFMQERFCVNDPLITENNKANISLEGTYLLKQEELILDGSAVWSFNGSNDEIIFKCKFTNAISSILLNNLVKITDSGKNIKYCNELFVGKLKCKTDNFHQEFKALMRYLFTFCL